LVAKDLYENKESLISTIKIDNEVEFEANSSPVIVMPSDPYEIQFIKPLTYNDDSTLAYLTSKVVDKFDNTIL
jgi:hypothetical protein